MRGFSRDITTPRTLLRRYQPSDLDRFTELMIDQDIQEFMGGENVGSEAEAASLFRRVLYLYSNPPAGRHFEIWAIEVNGRVSGHFELKQTPYTGQGELEVVYFIDKDLWGKGLMTEVLKAMNTYAQKLNRKLIATIDPGNIATVRTLEKTGIEKKGNIEVEGESIFKVWIRPPDHLKPTQ